MGSYFRTDRLAPAKGAYPKKGGREPTGPRDSKPEPPSSSKLIGEVISYGGNAEEDHDDGVATITRSHPMRISPRTEFMSMGPKEDHRVYDKYLAKSSTGAAEGEPIFTRSVGDRTPGV